MKKFVTPLIIDLVRCQQKSALRFPLIRALSLPISYQIFFLSQYFPFNWRLANTWQSASEWKAVFRQTVVVLVVVVVTASPADFFDRQTLTLHFNNSRLQLIFYAIYRTVNSMGWSSLDPPGSLQGQEEGCCEHIDETYKFHTMQGIASLHVKLFLIFSNTSSSDEAHKSPTARCS
jgi:hypothetical protein